MDYALLKSVHVSAVALSGAGFFARGLGSLAGARWVASRAARTLPHLVDTVLLASAVTLAWTYRISPAANSWLAAKIFGLVAYVVLGSIALSPRRPRRVRALAWGAALTVFAYIVSVAITKAPWGFLRLP